MVKLISAILAVYDLDITKEKRTTLSGKISDALKSQFIIKSKTEREPLVSKADKVLMNTAVVRLSQEELYICSMEMENKELSNFFGNLSNKLIGMEKERQREEVKKRTGAEICEPGVNCE